MRSVRAPWQLSEARECPDPLGRGAGTERQAAQTSAVACLVHIRPSRYRHGMRPLFLVCLWLSSCPSYGGEQSKTLSSSLFIRAPIPFQRPHSHDLNGHLTLLPPLSPTAKHLDIGGEDSLIPGSLPATLRVRDTGLNILQCPLSSDLPDPGRDR